MFIYIRSFCGGNIDNIGIKDGFGGVVYLETKMTFTVGSAIHMRL